MILRKPYAFLIKKFKLIHFILAGLIIYLIIRTNNVLTYFNEYSSSGVLNRVLASDYINLFMFFIVILIILGNIVVYLLMRFKNKPKLIYLVNIIGYFVVFIIMWVTLSVMKDLEFNILDTRIIRLVRDFLMISLIFQVGMLIFMLIRAFGFDIKKFNFADDIEELKIDVSDNEEFELVVGVDVNKLARKTRRKGREFKYFILENKFIFMLLSLVIVVVVAFSIFLNTFIFNRVYKEGQTFRTTYYTLNIKDSFYTEKTYDGELIKTNNKVFLVMQFSVKGIYENLTLNKNDMRLIIDGKKYFPNLRYYNQLFDIGVGYDDQKIGSKEKEYILVYEIDKEDVDKKKVWTYVDKITFTRMGIDAKYKKVNIKPTSLDTSTLVGENNIGMPLNFKDSMLGDTNLTINGYGIAKSFPYSYEVCNNNNFCQDINGTIIPTTLGNTKLSVLLLNMTYDGSVSKFDLINKFAKLYYNIGGVQKFYNNTLVNKTPNNYKGENIYLEIPEEVSNADNIWFEFNIRNKKYKYILK